MNKVIKILISRDGIDEEDARNLIKETIDEILCNPMDAEEIIVNYLKLEPDYIDDLINYV